MKKILLGICVIFLLTGCSADYNEHPNIVDYGKTVYRDDNINIEVMQAKSGLKGYSIEEQDNEIWVILKYDKVECNKLKLKENE